jgi:hypothetical protein
MRRAERQIVYLNIERRLWQAFKRLSKAEKVPLGKLAESALRTFLEEHQCATK